ncbi:hypothetical protein ACFE04_009295 [Oxalis oulophora]
MKRQLDAAAPVLAALKQPIVIAKLNADKYTRLAPKYDIEECFFNCCIQMVLPGPATPGQPSKLGASQAQAQAWNVSERLYFTGHSVDDNGNQEFKAGHTSFSHAIDGFIRILTIVVEMNESYLGTDYVVQRKWHYPQFHLDGYVSKKLEWWSKAIKEGEIRENLRNIQKEANVPNPTCGCSAFSFNLTYSGSSVVAKLSQSQDTFTLSTDPIPIYTCGCIAKTTGSSAPVPRLLVE